MAHLDRIFIDAGMAGHLFQEMIWLENGYGLSIILEPSQLYNRQANREILYEVAIFIGNEMQGQPERCLTTTEVLNLVEEYRWLPSPEGVVITHNPT
jgi:hypothetical protein